MNGENTKKQTHYYLFAGKRYENMKDCREAIGDGVSSKFFRHLVINGVVQKVQKDVHIDAESKSQRRETNEYKKQKKTA